MGLKALFNKDEVVGLDIGSERVSMVQMRRLKDHCRVTGAATAEIVPDTNDNSNMRQTKLSRAIAECRKNGKITAVNVVCGLSGPEVAVRKFQFPKLSHQELKSAVDLEASQVCPFDTSDAVTDFQLLEQSGPKVRGILVSATKRLIKYKSQLAKSAGLNCVLMDVDGLALLNSLLQYQQSKSAMSAVVNIEPDRAIVAVVLDGTEPFVRDLNYIKQTISHKISQTLGIPLEQAGQMLRQFEDPDTPDDSPVAQVLEQACDKLASGIMDTVKYHAAQQNAKGVKEIFVCGSLASAFYPLLSRKLEAKVQLWNPFDHIRCQNESDAEILKALGPTMAIAAGLSTRRI